MQLKKLCVSIGAGLIALGPVAALAGDVSHAAKPKMSVKEAQQRLNQRNARIIENKGQWDSRALFRARSSNLTVWTTKDGFVYEYARSNGSAKIGQAIHVTFPGGGELKPSGVSELPIVTTFATGRTDHYTAKSYAETISHNVYKGIDVRNYLEQERPRYDFLVAPGADASKIHLKFDGAKSVSVRNNEIVLGTQIGDLKNGSLKAYQIVNGHQKTVAAQFKKDGDASVNIALGAYDHSKTLIIDPLVYGTYYGGDGGQDEVRAVVSDNSGGTYLTGSTGSAQFPATYGPLLNLKGTTDAFLTKLQGDAYSHDFAAYVGGTGDEFGAFLQIDAFQNCWVVGRTTSANFPGNTISGTSASNRDIFVMRFTPDQTTVLAPAQTLIIGGTSQETVSGFAVVANNNPIAGDPVEFVLAGNTSAALKDSTGNFAAAFTSAAGYLARYSFDGTSFSRIDSSSFYINHGAGATISLTGLALDPSGAAYVGGTVNFVGNQDTSVGGTPAFVTTPGVFSGGRLLRNSDLFVQKYDRFGAGPQYSCLIGGNANDVAGGTDTDTQGNLIQTGSCVAVDASGNAYITGISGSFNFPRTRGVFGEVFATSANVTVTKLNSDASQIIYSTNLQTQGGVNPAGIAIDARGFAFITGNMHFNALNFPENLGQTAGDPNQPQNIVTPLPFAITQTTGDAISRTWASPAPPELPTCEPFINVLNDTATTLVYGSYLGSNLDDKVYAPYVDRFGDVWVMGWTDSNRFYQRFSSTGVPTTYNTNSSLPAGLISPLAFRPFGDAGPGVTFTGVQYGILNPAFPFVIPVDNPTTGVPILTIPVNYSRDGFVAKLRIGQAAIANLSFNPTTVAGGLGASTTGTVSLTSAAPPGGADVQVELNDTSAASFSSDVNNPVASQTVTIPEGLTSATFTLFSYPVVTSVQVQAKATFQGSFKIAQITVVPWLQQLGLTPTSVVGGNSSTGRVTLSQPAPTGGVTIDLLTDSPSLIVLPTSQTVTVAGGQTSATFAIGTHGVIGPQNTLITASLLGAGQSQTLTLTLASLLTVSFNPPTVAGGSVSTGTVTLDGEAGPTFTTNLTLNAGTAGYVITTADGTGTTNVPLVFNQGDKSKTFTLTTAYENGNTSRKVTAVRPAGGGYTASQATGTLFITALTLNNMTLTPNPVVSGNTVAGTVQLGAPAPAGGATVKVTSANPAIASINGTGIVNVSAGATTGTFTVATHPQSSDTSVVISATRGTGAPIINKTLTVKAQKFSMTVNPTTVVGGIQNSTGTVSLIGGVSATNVTVNLSSSLTSAASVPASVTIIAGQTSATFAITSHTVTTVKSVTITGTGPGAANTATATLTVKPLGLVSIVLTPSTLKGGTTFNVRVTLDANVAANTSLTLNYGSNASTVIANPNDKTLVIPANTNFGDKLNILTKKVSRKLSTTISVLLNGKTVSAVLTVNP